MNKYENTLVQILNGLGDYTLHTIEVDYEPIYVLSIATDFDEIVIKLDEDAYNTLVQLDKDINGREG